MTLTSAMQMITAMFGFPNTEAIQIELVLRPIHYVAGAAAIAVVWFAPTTQELVKKASPWWALALQPLFLLALLHLHYEDHVPFLYFQF